MSWDAAPAQVDKTAAYRPPDGPSVDMTLSRGGRLGPTSICSSLGLMNDLLRGAAAPRPQDVPVFSLS